MSKQLTAILGLLILLTFGGLLFVSNFIGRNSMNAEQQSAAPLFSVTPTAKTQLHARPNAADNAVVELQTSQTVLDDIYNSLRASDWAKAKLSFEKFKLKDERLPAAQLNQPDVSPYWQDFFDLFVVQLERAIAEKQTRQAAIALRQLQGIVGEVQTRTQNKNRPLEMQRLFFLLTELNLWVELNDEKMLRVRKVAFSEAWSDVVPLLRTKRGSEAAALEFSSLVAQLFATESPAKIAELVQKLAAQLQNLDNYFTNKQAPLDQP